MWRHVIIIRMIPKRNVSHWLGNTRDQSHRVWMVGCTSSELRKIVILIMRASRWSKDKYLSFSFETLKKFMDSSIPKLLSQLKRKSWKVQSDTLRIATQYMIVIQTFFIDNCFQFNKRNKIMPCKWLNIFPFNSRRT